MGKAFKFNLFVKIAFAQERKRRAGQLDNDFKIEFKQNKKTYWKPIEETPPVDAKQTELLSPFAKNFIKNSQTTQTQERKEKAPEDIYPVF